MAHKKNNPLVSIIILTHNSMTHIKNCLDSVQRLLYPNLEVILVDNASTDGSDEFVRVNYPWVKIIRNKENLGFAAGNNVGTAVANGRYVLFLNIDTEVTPYSVTKLVQVIEADSTIGVCGCKLLLFSRRDVFQSAGGKYSLLGIPWDRGTFERDNGQFDELEDVAFVCGAALLIRKDLVSRIGSFDPAFFAYNEDVDLCLRSWVCGFRVVYVPDAVVYHKWQLDNNRRQNPYFVFHLHKNTMMILLKNFRTITILSWFPLALVYEIFWFGNYLSRRNLSAAQAIINSLIWILSNFPYIIRQRQKIMHKRLKSDSILKKCCAPPREAMQEFRRRNMLKWGGHATLE
jgi:GT2 family glycosyltransferase